MNILKHKSWHVRTKKNIERVRRDEENARNAEEAKQKRVKLAESEARIKLLIDNSSQNINEKEIPSSSSTSNLVKKFDLFEDIKDKILNDNEAKEEKKKEQEKWEVKTGIFSYMDGRYKHENSVTDDWYLKSHEDRMKLGVNNEMSEQSTKKDANIKKHDDPYENVKHYLKVLKNVEESRQSSKIVSMSLKSPKEIHSNLSSLDHKTRHKKKKSKHRHHHEKLEGNRHDNVQDDEKKKNMIEMLRKKRLQREQKERQRTQQLLNKINGIDDNKSVEKYTDERKARFNSQFNPDIARQNAI